MKSFTRFFTLQFLGFVALAFLIVVVNVLLYGIFFIREMDANYNEDTPSLITKEIDKQLSAAEGAYRLNDKGVQLLDEAGAWALLVSDSGDVVWNYKVPNEIPKHFSLNDAALLSHYGYMQDYPSFIWGRDDGLLILGFPKESYTVFSTNSIPSSTIDSLPLYILIMLAVDLFIFFTAYMLSRRRTIKNITPISNALAELSTGGEVSLSLRGDLQQVGEQINKTSSIIMKKDSARDNWIRGISHDIRTPLSVITGYADGIANDAELPEKTRNEAMLIRTQGIKIKDLVLDLNVTSQLDFDMQPLEVNQVVMAKMLREIIADYLNGGLPEHYTIDLDITPDTQDLSVVGDERLLKRAIQNLVQNSINHNPQGCKIRIALFIRRDKTREQGCLLVIDNGKGIDQAKLAEVHARLFQARNNADVNAAINGNDNGIDTFHGLGLVLVEKIVRVHGGIMKVTSAENQGFTTEIYLPMQHLN